MAITTKKTPEKIVDIWQKFVNPLYGLTQRQIEQMLNFARAGNDVMLQQCYTLIEQTMPIFGICIDKRQSQIMDLEWKIEGENETAAKRVEEVFRRNQEEEEFDSVESAIEHLSLYSFRGRSCVKPFFKEGKLTLKRLNNWNILLSPTNKFYFNPSSSPALQMEMLQEVPSSEIAFCTTDRPIDLPGMLIYLRQLVGETKWAQFVERQGIPQVVLTAPEGTPDSALGMWTFRAQQIVNGGSGVLPPGAKVDELTAARGQDPFSEFCKHQMEMIAILATGGSLNTIGGNTGLGSNLAEVQNDQFNKLVRKDLRKIEKAMTKGVGIVARGLGLNPEGLRFNFVSDEDDTKEVLEVADKVKALGMTVDVEKMRKYIKYDIMADNQSEIWTPSEASPDDESKQNKVEAETEK